MRLIQARVQNYRSVIDTGWFDVEDAKTILVGPNEAGKTAVLEALQRINASDGVRGFDALRDYPRKHYNADIQKGGINPSDIPVASARFRLEPGDLDELPEGFKGAVYRCTRYLANNYDDEIEGGPEVAVFTEKVRNDLLRMANHVDQQTAADRVEDEQLPSAGLNEMIENWEVDSTRIDGNCADELREWLDSVVPSVDEDDSTENNRHSRLMGYIRTAEQNSKALEVIRNQLPVLVYFSSYYQVRPNIHLGRLADRLDQDLLDDDSYDYGNKCLLKLLGVTARELSDLGNAPNPQDSPEEGDDSEEFNNFRTPLDERHIQLNAASVRLTESIQSVWNPDTGKDEASTVRITADGQYLKVVVEDELGVEVELDQRSAGFQWLVSFFVVFFAEAEDAYQNAILLLDEPGLSLHGLKQREFRQTLSRLAEGNQTLYTTHSPFLVGPDELHLVRVVEMTDRTVGTKVHTTVAASDSAALLPLQEALGYDLAQSLFMHRRNLVLEGLTDYWYLDATAQLMRAAGLAELDERIALLPAGSAGKVVYFATILHANKLKVAALLDSDNAGNEAAKKDVLVHTLGNKNILRTADVCPDPISGCEIEDLLRDTLIRVASDRFGCDVTEMANSQSNRPIVDIFDDQISSFTKYHLAKAYVGWTREHSADDLSEGERESWAALIGKINQALN